MRPIFLLALLVAAPVAILGCARAAPPTPKTEDEKAVYALGVLLSRNIQPFALSDKELELLKAGIADGVHAKATAVDADAYIPKVRELQRVRLAAAGVKEQEKGKTYLDQAAAEKGAVKTASGLVITTVKEGTGAMPVATDQVKVNYEGKLIDGSVFDSSIKRGEPATFPLNGVIPCWTEALQLMKVGGKSRIVCPAAIAYGDRGAPPQIGPGSTLVFDVELLSIEK